MLAGLYVVTLAAAVPRPDGDGRDADWTSAKAQRFWGPSRMSAATPPQEEPDDAKSDSGASADRAAKADDEGADDPAQRITGSARHFDGIPTVGVLFYVGDDMKNHHCTASVVHSPKGNLLVTAGHCSLGDQAAFAPDYQKGAERQPYGVWAVDRTFTDPRRDDYGDGSDLDFAFATVKKNADGKQIESVTGANVLSRTPGYDNRVTVIGYPDSDDDPADRAIRCTAMTSRLKDYRQLRMECDGFYSGTSGSPWLAHFNEKTKTGELVGVLGGLNGGGPDGDDADKVSYSPIDDDEIFKLYDDAVHDRDPDRGSDD
ncbi:trypsin-like serine peptidase [Streptomyces sp. NPDC057654]|uniref:trypsin-like serine peptidase n=1 Tax=Streptomyces sp. NPDC057654 TaxID=3346196 RepID=UPI0036C7FEFF